MSVPLRFLFEHKKKQDIHELYLFMKLRFYAHNKAGYVQKEIVQNYLSHREKYIWLPKLRQRGWVNERNKLKSVHRILSSEFGKEEANNVHSKINYKYLSSLKEFKNFIFALTEMYIMKGKYIAESKGFRSWNPRARRFERQRITNRMGSTNETFRVRKTVHSREDLKNLVVSSEVYKGICEEVRREDCTGKFFDEKFAERFYHESLSLKSLERGYNHKGYYLSRISHSMLEKWGYKPWEIARRRSAFINSYSPREYVIVDPEREPAQAGKKSCFFSKKEKAFLKFLPTEVLCQSGNIYYYSQHTGKTLEQKKKSPKRPDDLCNVRKPKKRHKTFTQNFLDKSNLYSIEYYLPESLKVINDLQFMSDDVEMFMDRPFRKSPKPDMQFKLLRSDYEKIKYRSVKPRKKSYIKESSRQPFVPIEYLDEYNGEPKDADGDVLPNFYLGKLGSYNPYRHPTKTKIELLIEGITTINSNININNNISLNPVF